MIPHDERPNSMPTRDPNNWQMTLEGLRHLLAYLPNIGAAALTFALALTRGIQRGGPFKKSFLNALTCTLLATGLFPLFTALAARYDLPLEAAFAPCVFLAVMGVDWLRAKADDLYEVFIGRWRS